MRKRALTLEEFHRLHLGSELVVDKKEFVVLLSKRKLIRKIEFELRTMRRQMREQGYLLWHQLSWLKRGRGRL